MTSEEKRGAIIRIITGLVVTGGLLAVSARDLASMRSRLRGALGEAVERSMSQETRLVLGNLLDDATLHSLAGAEGPELERLARVLRDDPTAAVRLGQSRAQLRAALATGAQTATDLEFAILRLRLQQARVPSAQVERLVTALRAAGIPGAGLGAIEGDLLTALRRIDDSLASGDMRAAIAAVDGLPPSFTGDARTALERTLAAAHGRTDPAWYRNPQALMGGRAVAPTARGGNLYHGASGSDMSPTVVFEHGMPARGPNVDIESHVGGARDTAFRGTTTMPMTPDGEAGAAHWAGEGGWVYQIDGTPSWDANQLMQGRVRTPGGFGGNPMRGELESLVPAGIPRERIRGAYPVVAGRGTSVRLGPFQNNPNYRPPP
jgi:hypothetical protein